MVAANPVRRSGRQVQKPQALVPGDPPSTIKKRGGLGARKKIAKKITPKGAGGSKFSRAPRGATKFTAPAGEREVGLRVACYWYAHILSQKISANALEDVDSGERRDEILRPWGRRGALERGRF